MKGNENLNPNLQVVPAATWMADSLIERGKLQQYSAAFAIERDFSKKLVYLNDNATLAINRAVLTNFHSVLRKKGYKAVWNNAGKWWTVRKLS